MLCKFKTFSCSLHLKFNAGTQVKTTHCPLTHLIPCSFFFFCQGEKNNFMLQKLLCPCSVLIYWTRMSCKY